MRWSSEWPGVKCMPGGLANSAINRSDHIPARRARIENQVIQTSALPQVLLLIVWAIFVLSSRLSSTGTHPDIPCKALCWVGGDLIGKKAKIIKCTQHILIYCPSYCDGEAWQRYARSSFIMLGGKTRIIMPRARIQFEFQFEITLLSSSNSATTLSANQLAIQHMPGIS